MRHRRSKICVFLALALLAWGKGAHFPSEAANVQVIVPNGLSAYAAVDGTYLSFANNDRALQIYATTGNVGENKLLTSKTSYSELRSGANGTYISASNTTAANLKSLDDNLAKLGVVDVISTDETTVKVTSAEATETIDSVEKNVKTYTVEAQTGAIGADAKTLVTGGTVYSEVHLDTNGKYVQQTNTTAANLKALDDQATTNTEDIADFKDMSNLTTTGVKNLKTYAQEAVQLQAKAGSDSISVVAGEQDGAGNLTYSVTAKAATITAGDTGLVTGGQAYTELRSGADGKKISAAQSVATNLLALDKQVETNRVDIQNLQNMTNLTPEGKTVIKQMAQNAVKVQSGNETIISVTPETIGDTITYSVKALTGDIAPDRETLVTGGKVYNEVHLASDGNYVRQSYTTAGNLSALDTQVKTNSDLIIDLDNRVGDKIQGLFEDMAQIGADASALSALRPEAYDPDDRWSFAVGYGHYKNRNAGAVGVFFKPDIDTTFSVGSTVWSGDPMMNFGASFRRKRTVGAYRTGKELAHRIRALEAAGTKRNAAAAREDKRMAKMEAAHALRERRMAYLEAENRRLQESVAAQASANAARAKEIAALRAQNVELQADNGRMEQEIIALLSKREASGKEK